MNFLLELLYPKLCVGCGRFGSYLCQKCEKNIGFQRLQYCPACKYVSKRGLTHEKCKPKTRLNGIQSLVLYDGVVRQLIQKIKYKGAFEILSEVLPRFLDKVTLEFEPDLVLIPVPLSQERFHSRGFNQAELICKGLATYFGTDYNKGYLIRSRETITQTKLTREERLINLKNAFKASAYVRGKNFLLIDDVWTTGATLNEAARELKREGAKRVYAFTIAVGK